nr:zinc finger, CCHC-type [Tanacetum cinerariifolium]
MDHDWWWWVVMAVTGCDGWLVVVAGGGGDVRWLVVVAGGGGNDDDGGGKTDSKNATMEQLWKRAKWDNDDNVCKGLILNGIHLRIEEFLKVQDNDKLKGNTIDSPSVVNMMEHNTSFRYNDNKDKHKHQDTKANPNKKSKATCWKCRKPKHLENDCKCGKVGNKANGSGTNDLVDGSTNLLKGQNMFNKSLLVYYVTYVFEAYFVQDDEVAWWVDSGETIMAVVKLLDPKLKCFSERGIECFFLGYVKRSKAFRFYVIEPNDSVVINSIIESRDAIFDENKFSSVPRLSQRSLINRTNDIGGSVVLEKVIDEAANLLVAWIFKRKLKVDGTVEKFKASTIRLLIAMSSIHNLIIHQMDVKKTFLNGKLKEEDMGEADVILGKRIKHESNGIVISKSYYIKKVLKKFNYFDCTLVSTLMDTSEKLMPNNGQVVSQLEYSRVIGCLMYAMTCTRPDIAFAVGKLSKYTSNPGTQHWQSIQQINNAEDNSSTSGWVFLLGGGEISWAFKKQTCITGSIIESKFVALAAAGKAAEWLKNLLLEIPLWVKPIAPISIHCDSAATLAKAYSQMYNGKSRHLGVRHSMIRELITNKVVSIEFMSGLKHMYLHIIPSMCLEPAEKEDEVVNFLMVHFFEKVLSRSMNKEEPHMQMLRLSIEEPLSSGLRGIYSFVELTRVVDENLPQLLDSRGGSHVTNVPAFEKEDFTSWKVRFLVFLDGLEPYILNTLEDGPFVPMLSLSTSENPLPKCQNQWSNDESRLANQDKRLKAHKGPSDIRDTKIAALRLKFNAFKSLKVVINSIIESRDAIFDENKFSSIPRPSQRSLINGTNDIGGSVVLEKVTDEAANLLVTWIFKRKLKVDGTVKKFKARNFFIKVFYKGHVEADVILVSTLMDTSEKLMPNNGQVVSQLEYSRVIGCLMYAMTCIRPDIAFAVGKLSKYTSNPGTQHWQSIQQAFKKQTCITGSIIESEFVALAAAGKAAEWLKNLLLEIPLWVKPIAPISIHCDSAATLAKAYSQMYNGKSRHLGVRHNMIRELIKNGVVSIEFMSGLKHMYLHIIPSMCLEPAEKEDEVVNFLMVNFFEKVLSRSMNKEEPHMQMLRFHRLRKHGLWLLQ